ncbi:MAG: hypothetical protein K6T51_14500 [Rubrobacteraceae bacterium]|nr:hypothetical protein [Rubrobacter naiadicus]MBX6763728.1 hypothetical protein [Rubrobacteraceae bacterium]MCL6439809.1 hypothetical protein [Rubrobacteraceae bacterium]
MGKLRIAVRILRSPLGRQVVYTLVRSQRVRRTAMHLALRVMNRRLRRR